MASHLTDRQRMVLAYLIRHVEAKGYPPTIREIMAEFGIGSLAGADGHLRALERKRYLAREADASPRYRIVRDLDGDPVRLAFVKIQGRYDP